MTLSDRQLFHHIIRMPLVDARELALVLGESLAMVHRAQSGLLADGIAGPVSHGTSHPFVTSRQDDRCDGNRPAPYLAETSQGRPWQQPPHTTNPARM